MAAAAMALALASCGAGKQATIADLGGEWVITSADGNTLNAETTPFIGINADRITSADFSIVFVISFCVFGLLSDIVVFNAFKTIALPVILLFEISILVSRIRKISEI